MHHDNVTTPTCKIKSCKILHVQRTQIHYIIRQLPQYILIVVLVFLGTVVVTMLRIQSGLSLVRAWLASYPLLVLYTSVIDMVFREHKRFELSFTNVFLFGSYGTGFIYTSAAVRTNQAKLAIVALKGKEMLRKYRTGFNLSLLMFGAIHGGPLRVTLQTSLSVVLLRMWST
jgi:hypothetical protein